MLLNCKQKDSSIKHIFQEGDSSRLDNFFRLIQLTKLHLNCLEMITSNPKDLEKFTLTDEKGLIEMIQGALKFIRNDLVSLDMKDLNHIEIALSDYITIRVKLRK